MWRAAAVVVVAALGLTLPGQPASAAEPGGIDWQPCTIDNPTDTQDFECGRLEVPIDRTQPDGPTFSLALARHRSTGTADQRIGSLLYNPGGPGGSGVDALPFAWALLPERVREQFDLVSWDPRGVGRTTPAPIACAPLPGQAISIDVGGPIAWGPLAAQLDDAVGRAHADCQSANATIVSHLGTVDTVADLDAIRAAVGDSRLTYWGTSYGTALGYAYAVAHPDRVRAVVLDSPVDPSPVTSQRLVEFAQARAEADGLFARFYPESAGRFRAVLAALDRDPVPLLRGTTLDPWTAVALLEQFTPFQYAYPKARSLVDAMHAVVFGSRAERAVARARLTTLLEQLQAVGDDWWVPSAIWCADVSPWPSPPQVASMAARLDADVSSQVAMQVLDNAAMCSGYTFPTTPLPSLTSGAGPRAPILVIGSTHDGRTNGDWIARMADAFPGARSITYEGGQHGVYRTLGSACLDRPTTAFLITGVLPVRDLTCANTYRVGGLVRRSSE